MKTRAHAVILVGTLAGMVALSGCRTDTYLGRWFRWRRSDVEDFKRFPSHAVDNAPPVFQFAEAPTPRLFRDVEYRQKGKVRVGDLAAMAEATGTTALIVIRDDAIVYEGYFNGHRRSSISTSFSVAKSVTSALVGIAIDEGHFRGMAGSLPESGGGRHSRVNVAGHCSRKRPW